MGRNKDKRKRAIEAAAADVIDLTNEPDEPTPKKSKNDDNRSQRKSQSFRQAPAQSSSGNSNRQRWVQMGWKNNSRAVPAPVSRFPNFSHHSPPPTSHPTSGSFENFPSPDVFSHPSQQFRPRFRPDPEDFRPVVDSLCSDSTVYQEFPRDGQWSRLTQDLARFFNNTRQERRLLDRKIELWSELYRCLHQDLECGLAVTGSTFNGFGGAGADLDMCLYPQGPAVSGKQWLSMVRKLLRQKCRNFIRGDIQLINAKVPILKFHDDIGRLEVDLSVNNPTSARNTHLLYCYSQLDHRVRPLVLALKKWAKNNNINEARLQTLSSYTLSLMVIHYLQCGVSPPVLPCLQKSHPRIFNPESDIFSLPYSLPSPAYTSNNTESLGKLFVGFFKYYTNPARFDTNHDVASVREGRVLRREDCETHSRLMKTGPGQWSACLFVEEPMDRTNAARAVCSQEKWNLVRTVFNSTMDIIERTSTWSLNLEHFLSSRNIKYGKYL